MKRYVIEPIVDDCFNIELSPVQACVIFLERMCITEVTAGASRIMLLLLCNATAPVLPLVLIAIPILSAVASFQPRCPVHMCTDHYLYNTSTIMLWIERLWLRCISIPYEH